MLEQRLQQRLRLVLIPPAILVVLISVAALAFGHVNGLQPRESLFDLFLRTAPRETRAEPVSAIVDIDEASVAALGPWPWPRTALAQLVTAAGDAGARAVVVTVPAEGDDPLSPEVFSRFLGTDPTAEQAADALSLLPTNNAALAAAGRSADTAISVGPSPAPLTDWARADVGTTPWMVPPAGTFVDFISLPAAPVREEPYGGFRDTALLSVASVPADADGTVRRIPLLWSLDGQPAPAAGFAPFALTDDPLVVEINRSRLRAGGPPPRTLQFREGGTIPLGARADVRLWLPSDPALPTIPAWRVLEGGEPWTGPLAGKVVFIGESVSERSHVKTARGEVPLAQAHALLTEQLLTGVPVRPGWAPLVEAGTALSLGLLAVGAAIFLRPLFATLMAVGTPVVTTVVFYLVFAQTELLLDPTPVAAASFGGPLLIFALVIGNILVRDDALRGAFHGALPPDTMGKLQTRTGGRLLRGVRRDVTVLSCGLRLPPRILERFENRPDDFIRFTAAANDSLRRTILAHDGTVDYGEDGRLLGYWNVPEQRKHSVEKACACALKMLDGMNALSEDLETAAYAGGTVSGRLDPGFAEASVEIGLAVSPCFAGPVGRGNRNRYAVIGEAVKIAAALRQRASRYGPAIITDDVIFDALRHHYAFLDLDVVRLTPDDAPRTVYGLVGNPFLKASKSFRQLADIQRDLVLSWRSGDIAQTTVQLQRLRGMPGVPDVYVEMFDERIKLARGATDTADTARAIEKLTF